MKLYFQRSPGNTHSIWYYKYKSEPDGPTTEEPWESYLPNYFYHREDGPAVEFPSGNIQWWLYDIHYNFERWLERTPISLEEKVLLKLRYG